MTATGLGPSNDMPMASAAGSSCGGGRIGIEAHGVREHDAVGNAVRHVGRPAQHVAYAVMQSHFYAGQRQACQVGAEQHLGAGFEIVSVGVAAQQRSVNVADPAQGGGGRKRIARDRIQGFDAVRQRVDAGGGRHFRRQIEGQLGIVDDQLGRDPRVADRDLARRGLLVSVVP